MDNNKIDIKENYIFHLDNELLKILIKDRSSKQNIIWATDNYVSRGYGYQHNDMLSITAITGRNGKIIKPRIEKSKKELLKRTRDKAEVFTPSWICNAQNNLIDEAWLGYPNAFNWERKNSWKTNINKLAFSQNKTWKDYVKDIRLEISCGEAPYLISRYDTVSGDVIAIENRIGLLDRKLRVIGENITTEQDWIDWVVIAYKSIYGYDWQGDNVLISRENMLLTYIDYYKKRFEKEPKVDSLLSLAEIISWNIWQMDGLKGVIPNSCKEVSQLQISMFDEKVEKKECRGCTTKNIHDHNGIYCRIKDWERNKPIKFVSMIARSSK